MAFRTDRCERMRAPDGYGKRIGTCGDTVELFLKVVDSRIQGVSFVVDGCVNTAACCNTVAQLVEGRRVPDAWKLTPESVEEYLETLPLDHRHCAELSVGALYLALSDYQKNNRTGWKTLYNRHNSV